ncbi:hypothetical protein SUDANB121_04302 [Nocardiopsis dassonvillei]|uniref:glycerophosphoryl diester phosphodiesterase membrane domain-containing protein n=1 Tax=Nocardiopsis dassonvillei TaxID=2014 RepID=UPI003F54E263
MTQEDDHRNPPGGTPEEPVDGGSPAAGAQEGPGAAESWAPPEQGASAPEAGGAHAQPAPRHPSFAPPGTGAPEGFAAPGSAGPGTGGQDAGFAAPGSGGPADQAPPAPGYGQQAGHGGPYGYGQQYGGRPGHGPTGPQAPGHGHPQAPAQGFAAPGYGQQPGYGPPPGQAQWAGPQGPQTGQWQAAPGGYPQGAGYGHPGYGQVPQAPKPGVVALRPMTLGDILNGAFTLIRRNPRTMVGLALMIMAVTGVISSIGFGGYASTYGVFLDQLMNDPMALDPNDPLPIGPWAIAAMYAGGLLSSLGIAIVTGLLTATVGMAVLGRKLSPSEAWASAKGRIRPVIGLALLRLLIDMAITTVVVVIGVAAVLVGMLIMTGGSEGAGAAVIILGLLAAIAVWIVLRVWIFVRIKFAMPAVVLERIGVGSALGRSWRLTQGSWWRIFLVLFLTLLISYFVTNILITPFTLGGMVPAALAPGALWAAVLAGALMFIGQALTYAIVTPFEVGVTTLLYVDLRMRREGLDLKLHTAAASGGEVGPEVYLPERHA